MQINKKRASGDCSGWKFRTLACGAAIVCAFAVSGLKASATNIIVFTYDYAGLQATFSDVSGGGVKLSLSASSATETINALYFNLDPSLSASSLVFDPLSSGGDGFDNPVIQSGTDAFKVDGGGKYDIKFSFQNNTLAQGTAVFDISGITGLTAADFNYYSTEVAGGNGATESSAILTAGVGSPFVALDSVNEISVPDGFATAILLGVGILCIEWMRRNRVVLMGCPVKTSGLRKKI